jgi:hypothetical protein
MVGGGALLAALASGTGTAALILLLARRPGPSAAALGVTGAYAGAGAFLAREGLIRLREAGPPLPDVPDRDEPGQTSSKTSNLRSNASSRQRSRHRCPRRRSETNRVRRPSKPSDARRHAPSRHRSRPIARSRSQSQPILAVAPPVPRRTARGERPEPEPLARPKAGRAARAESHRAHPAPWYALRVRSAGGCWADRCDAALVGQRFLPVALGWRSLG